MSNPILGKRIVLGVTGSISAYKAADLASKLTQAGAVVDVILTEAAARFVSPLTFQSVTGRKAYTDNDLWGGEGHVTHVGLGRAAELMVIAPASATTIAKLAHGIGDNLLSLTALAASCRLVIAPAMDAGMYSHPATQANVQILKERGVFFIGPGEGRLASGLIGLGRLVEPADILGQIRYILSRSGPLAGRRIVVTAGGTEEAIDPVRVITNRSSGKQGFAVAQAALDAGAEVTLISAHVALETPAGARRIEVRSASQLLDVVMAETQDVDALVMVAAVADYRPAKVADQKIKKSQANLTIQLEPTTDILSALAERRAISGFPRRMIGFAAESSDVLTHASHKLQSKKLDMIVANDVLLQDSGFEADTNKVILLFEGGRVETLPMMTKAEVGDRIVRQLTQWFVSSRS